MADLKSKELVRWNKQFIEAARAIELPGFKSFLLGLKNEQQLDCILEVEINSTTVHLDCTLGCNQHSVLSISIADLETYLDLVEVNPFLSCRIQDLERQVNDYVGNQRDLASSTTLIDLEAEEAELIALALES